MNGDFEVLHEGNPLYAEITRLRTENEIFWSALNHIASWGEGDEVNSGFDEPNSAETAREALAKVRK